MRIGWLIALASGILDCGARTGIDLETADGSIFGSLSNPGAADHAA
jgi:hypothetical protein